jgi:hypothetical protein
MEAHADLRAILTDALRYWERLRLPYKAQWERSCNLTTYKQ